MLHQLRQQDVEQLLKKNMITVNDIMGLDWGGRFAIANRHFDKCDDAAKQALLHDQHHAVRAAASLVNSDLKLIQFWRSQRFKTDTPPSPAHAGYSLLSGLAQAAWSARMA